MAKLFVAILHCAASAFICYHAARELEFIVDVELASPGWWIITGMLGLAGVLLFLSWRVIHRLLPIEAGPVASLTRFVAKIAAIPVYGMALLAVSAGSIIVWVGSATVYEMISS